MLHIKLKKVCVQAFEKSIAMMNRCTKYFGYKKGFTLDIALLDFDDYVNTTINNYRNYRKPEEISNQKLLSSLCIQCSKQDDNCIVMDGIFRILDQALFFNGYFNGEQNYQIFTEVIPYPKYLCLKFKCLEILKRKVSLSIYDAIWFFICLDCSSQILLGDKADDMNRMLDIYDFGPIHRSIFISHGTYMFNELKKMLQTSNAHFSNLEIDYNWIERIR